MTDPEITEQTSLQTELSALRNIMKNRSDRLSELAESIGTREDISDALAMFEQELATEQREHRVRLALLKTKYAISRDGAVQGVAPLAEQIAVLQRSPHFSATWYLQTNADISASGQNPAEHYVRSGAFEGRDPGPDFSTMTYYHSNPDVAQSGWAALVHWELYGRDEGRSGGSANQDAPTNAESE